MAARKRCPINPRDDQEWVWICWNDTKEHELKKSKEVDTETGILEAMAPATAKYSDGKFYPCLVMGKSDCKEDLLKAKMAFVGKKVKRPREYNEMKNTKVLKKSKVQKSEVEEGILQNVLKEKECNPDRSVSDPFQSNNDLGLDDDGVSYSPPILNGKPSFSAWINGNTSALESSPLNLPSPFIKIASPQPSLTEFSPSSSSTPAKAIDGFARKKTAELEKKIEEMTIWCSRMEQMLVKLMGDKEKEASRVEEEDEDDIVPNYSKDKLKEACKKASGGRPAVRKLATILFDENQLSSCSVKGFQTRRGKQLRPGLPPKRLEVLYDLVRKYWSLEIKEQNLVLNDFLKSKRSIDKSKE